MNLLPAAALSCRPSCAACCTAPSISSAIPGMPQGKPAGVACVQLDAQRRCKLFGRADRPAVCASLTPSAEMCGGSREQAMRWLDSLEAATAPLQLDNCQIEHITITPAPAHTSN